MLAAAEAGTLQTLPYWQGSFSVLGRDYNYTIVGGDPSLGGTTTIPCVIVPIRLTIADYSSDGTSSLVLDASSSVRDTLNSPIFKNSDYIAGPSQQFTDAMLHAEFPQAATNWHTILSPTVGATIDITVPKGKSQVYQAKSGKLLAVITDDSVIDDPIFNLIDSGTIPPSQNTIFVTYNALEHDAFGYHAAEFLDQNSQEIVFSYNSWLEDVDDLFSIPSPDAATLSHEIAETVHDAFNGHLFQPHAALGRSLLSQPVFSNYIEVGDAVEDAPAHIQLHEQVDGFRNLMAERGRIRVRESRTGHLHPPAMSCTRRQSPASSDRETPPRDSQRRRVRERCRSRRSYSDSAGIVPLSIRLNIGSSITLSSVITASSFPDFA